MLSPMNIDRDALFERLAIPVPKGEQAQFFFGDNREGYWEGFTHAHARGAGYVLKRDAIFRDFSSWRGERRLDRSRATGAAIYPYGVRHMYGNAGWEEAMLLNGRPAMALRVASRRPRSLALAPLFAIRGSHALQKKDGLYLLSSTAPKSHVAFSSPQPFSHDGNHEFEGLYAPTFRTRGLLREFTLYIAFAETPARALSLARRLSAEGGVGHHQQRIFDCLARSALFTNHEEYSRAAAWAKLASLFMVTEEFGKGIWAGLPWFKDNWGRDTFIALPGTLLVSGFFDEAKEVIRVFSSRQDTDPRSPTYGRVPNRVAGETDIIYNTADGTPWLIREIGETLHYTGDLAFAEEMFPVIQCAIDGAFRKFADGHGFITHDDADTWMDARINGKAPWSARGDRAVEIQALWHTALGVGARVADLVGRRALARAWRARAETLARNFKSAFWDSRRRILADRLRPDGSRDTKIRPNQLMVLSIPFEQGLLDPETEARVLKTAFEELCFPYGICSLSPNHPYFHPYHHRDELWHFDAAYHNGTIWGWNAGFTITALCRHAQTECAWALARNLADQILHLGCRGGMSELLDALPSEVGRPTPSGTWQQAWSTAEFARNAYQDFAGFLPRLLDGRLLLHPHLPAEWTNLSAVFPFGHGGRLHVHVMRTPSKDVFLLEMEGPETPLDLHLRHDAFGRRFDVVQPMKHGDSAVVSIEGAEATVGVNGKWGLSVLGVSHPKVRPLRFAMPPVGRRFKTLEHPHYLQRIIESGRFR